MWGCRRGTGGRRNREEGMEEEVLLVCKSKKNKNKIIKKESIVEKVPSKKEKDSN